MHSQVTDEVSSVDYSLDEARRLIEDRINIGVGCPGKAWSGGIAAASLATLQSRRIPFGVSFACGVQGL